MLLDFADELIVLPFEIFTRDPQRIQDGRQFPARKIDIYNGTNDLYDLSLVHSKFYLLFWLFWRNYFGLRPRYSLLDTGCSKVAPLNAPERTPVLIFEAAITQKASVHRTRKTHYFESIPTKK